VKIGELARITGCPVTRIRFYEQKGLLPMPSRTPGGHRNYSDKAIERLDFISTCRANGMKLECIERFIAFEKDPSLGSQWLLERIDEYLQQAKIQRERLDKAEQKVAKLSKGADGAPVESPFISEE
jgi:DNA-binding transcriptional MerR regulator